MTGPSLDDLRRAGAEAAARPYRQRMDQLVAGLPWHGRIIYRAALPIVRAWLRLTERKPR